MKASIVPAANQKWEIKDLPRPEPGPNQVLIKMHASGICYTDVHQTKGELSGVFPRTLGHEPVREIISVGAGVRGRKMGDRVGVPWVQTSCMHCEWCLRGKPPFTGGLYFD
jgi:alcohol dehydrogenase